MALKQKVMIVSMNSIYQLKLYTDLKIAMQVLGQLATRLRKYTHSESRSQSGHSHSKIFRSRTWPRQKPQVHGDIELGITGVSAMKLRPHSADKCSHCSSSNTIAVYKGLKRYSNKSITENIYMKLEYNHISYH